MILDGDKKVDNCGKKNYFRKALDSSESNQNKNEKKKIEQQQQLTIR